MGVYLSAYGWNKVVTKIKEASPSQLGLKSLQQTRTFFASKPSKWLYLSLLGMSIPVLGYELISGAHSISLTHDIKRLAAGGQKTDLGALFGVMADYMLPVFPLFLFLCLIQATTYLVFIAQSSSAPNTPLLESLKACFQTILFRGVKVAVLVSMVLSAFMVVFQGFIFLFFVLAALSLMVPVLLMLSENKGAFKIIKEAATMDYATKLSHSKWGVLFQLVSYAACGMILLLVINSLYRGVLFLDDFIGGPRGPYVNLSVFGLFTWPYLIAICLKSLLLGWLGSFFAVFTTQYYLALVQSPDSD